MSKHDADDLAAGQFSPWLRGLEDALRTGAPSAVPCGACTACCTSSQFVHIGPDERDTLAHVPAELRFAAPGLPDGHVVMGYDERGHCPMFVDGGCSIYAHRPRTCRVYDCRVFAATGISPGADAHPAIAAQSGRWRFDLETPDDELRRGAVRSAAAALPEAAAELPDGAVPRHPARLAVLAVEIHDEFLDTDAGGRPVALRTPAVDELAAAVGRRTG